MTTVAAELAAHGYAGAARDLYNRSATWYAEQPAGSVAHRNWHAFTVIAAQRWDEARAVCQSLLDEAPENGWFHALDGYAAARTGDQGRAASQLEWLEAQEGTAAYQGAVHAALGDKARALELIAEGFDGGDYFSLWSHRDPLLFPLLGDDPAWKELMNPKG